MRQLSTLIKLDVEGQLNFDSYTLNDKQQEYKIKARNIVIPVKFHAKIYKNLNVLGGLEYLGVVSKKSDFLELRRNNINALTGFSYLIQFKNFKMMPEIAYRTGANNIIKTISLPALNNFNAKRATVMFTLKVM